MSKEIALLVLFLFLLAWGTIGFASQAPPASEEELAELAKIEDTLEQMDEKLNALITKMDEMIAKLDNFIARMDESLQRTEDLIAEMDESLKELERQFRWILIFIFITWVTVVVGWIAIAIKTKKIAPPKT